MTEEKQGSKKTKLILGAAALVAMIAVVAVLRLRAQNSADKEE